MKLSSKLKTIFSCGLCTNFLLSFQAPSINVGGRAVTIAKYVTLYKQKGGAAPTGSRNTKRFRSSANVENNEDSVIEEIHPGDFFFSKTYGVVEILQLCRKKTYVNSVTDLTNINFIGVPYRRVDKSDVHYACSSFTRKYYSVLSDMFKKKVSIYQVCSHVHKLVKRILS